MSSDPFTRRGPTGARQAPTGPRRAVDDRHEALAAQAVQQPRGLRRVAVPKRPLHLRAAGARPLEQERQRTTRLPTQPIRLDLMTRPRQQRGGTATLAEDRRLHQRVRGTVRCGRQRFFRFGV